MHMSNRERRAAVPEQPPMHAPSHRSSNNAGARGHHQNGRFVSYPQPHGRGGEGYNTGGSRRPVGGANGKGNADVHGHANASGNSYHNNRGGGWHGGQEHRGGFNGQPHGRGHQDGHHGPGHMPLRPLMGYVEAPPHHMLQPPPFMGMAPMPPYPYYYGSPVGYGPYGYPPGALPPFMEEALPPFMQYAPPQIHMMHTNLEQQADPLQMEPQQQQNAPQQPAKGQQAPLNQEQQQTPEQLQQDIRKQIEYYFR
ncbi:hypothetical protein BAE44_0021280 [Dichanthelium oligosanthes]|uniref:Uncharacterized protein n=1 Tax=Dichanthelium oligosanthes TaxID=888268 RepID=A0A1E5UXQ9_9POAL|nr:hypothetical protein BAE44_0021280 [Dichanthelium oligosanthes]